MFGLDLKSQIRSDANALLLQSPVEITNMYPLICMLVTKINKISVNKTGLDLLTHLKLSNVVSAFLSLTFYSSLT